MHKHNRLTSGFTIVELLIVIVVIAILAAISIVAFKGIQERARASEASAGLTQAKTKLELYKVDEGTYPATGNLAHADVKDSDVTYQYTSDGTTYCLTATVGTISYKASNTTSPVQGGCAGHGQGGVAAITNLAMNPSSEVSALWMNGPAPSTATRVSEEAQSGAHSTRLVKSGDYAYVRPLGAYMPVSEGESITTCAWVKTSAPSVRLARRISGGGWSSVMRPVPANSWTYICDTYTIPDGVTTFVHDIGWERKDVADGTVLYVDGVMITRGSTQYGFADGNSPSWIWNGMPNNSTSTGPAL